MARRKQLAKDARRPRRKRRAPKLPVIRAGAAQPARFPIVMLGASAGGLEAYKRFLARMPSDSGLAFVLVPHLAPKFKSMMSELLARHTSMPVREAADREVIRPNHVYVIPPNRYLRVLKGKVVLSRAPERHGQGVLDVALESLAVDQKENAIGVILSGTGSHGTNGLRAIREAGGITLVQDPATAQYDQMPRNAVSNGAPVDHVLAPEAMPDVLVGYSMRSLSAHEASAPLSDLNLNEALTVIGALLRTRTKFDIRHYRKIMVVRRIRRRMALARIDSFQKFIELLRQHPAEVTALRDDLLIGVTSFFRQPQAFNVLSSRALGKLVERSTAERPLRAWVPACATGEEAYTLAMLLIEAFSAAGRQPHVQIFATDADSDSLRVARAGVYPESIASALTPQRLTRFFTRQHPHRYRVSAELRECIAFAPHDILVDPPFSRLDLVSCRNVLIYFEAGAQAKIISLFHFSLNEGGYLFLGAAESIGKQEKLFEPISRKWRIYQRHGPARRETLDRLGINTSAWGRLTAQTLHSSRPSGDSLGDMLQRLLLREYVPAAVLVNRSYEVLSVQGPVVGFLEFPAGKVTKDLLNLCRPGLRAKIRAACERAYREGCTIEEQAHVRRDGSAISCSIHVRPLREADTDGRRLLLVVFRELHGEAKPVTRRVSGSPHSTALDLLEEELRATNEDLRTTIEDAEESKQALRTSNEEVMSMNEELQSANEELETSKEELQSLNEELIAVNNQLEAKVEDLDTANNDMSNLMAATDIPIVFLDSQLRIKRFTQPTQTLLNLLESDVGRAFADLALKLDDALLLKDARRVMETGTPAERVVRTADGRSYLRGIQPYQSPGGTGGVVLTFVDISRQIEMDAQLRRFAAVLRDSTDAIMVIDLDGRITAWNRGAEKLYGYDESEALNLRIRDLLPAAASAGTLSLLERGSQGAPVQVFETERRTKDGRIVHVSSTLALLQEASGKPTAFAITDRDLTISRRAEAVQLRNVSLEQRVAERTNELQQSEERLRATLDANADAIITFDADGRVVAFNKSAERMFGYAADEVLGHELSPLIPLSEVTQRNTRKGNRWLSRAQALVGGVREVVGIRKGGAEIPIRLLVSRVEGRDLFVASARDMTEYKAMQSEILDIAVLEQRRIGEQLHDGTQQELTGLGLLARGLSDTLGRGGMAAESKLAARLATGLAEANLHVRAIVSGMVPVPMDREALRVSLSELARVTEENTGIRCYFDSPQRVAVDSDSEATHLFRLAQEAVNNAVRHAGATEIRIRLEYLQGQLRLEVSDNGRGIDEKNARSHGVGLRLMAHRCEIMGGSFALGRNGEAGTSVVCALPGKDDA